MPLLKLSRLLFSQKKIHQNVWCSSPKFLNAWQGITYTPVIYKYFLWRYMSLIVEWFYWIYAMFLVFRKGLVILHFLAVSFHYQSYQYHSTISIVFSIVFSFILNWFCDNKILKKAHDMTDWFCHETILWPSVLETLLWFSQNIFLIHFLEGSKRNFWKTVNLLQLLKNIWSENFLFYHKTRCARNTWVLFILLKYCFQRLPII